VEADAVEAGAVEAGAVEVARISRSWRGVENKERKVSIYCKLYANLG
jgi:hypothetical protein